MSRLDFFIDRLLSQRACLDYAIARTDSLPGPIFELGLGNGRTYDHLREKVGRRQIFVFERQVASNPASTPTDEELILGDMRQTLPEALANFGATASLIHGDFGGHNLEKNDKFAQEISPAIEPLLAKGAIMVSSDRMYFDKLKEMALPEGALKGRCFIYSHDGQP